MGKLSELIEKNKRLEDHFNNNQREHLSGIYKMLISSDRRCPRGANQAGRTYLCIA